MANNELILYPSNWLYNAGVIGLLRVLEAGGHSDNSLVAKDGTISGREMIDRIQRHLSNLTTNLPKPLSNLPTWHWNFVSESFDWNYGSVQDLVKSNLNRASRMTNRKAMLDQLQCKNFKYDDMEIDFSQSNEAVKSSFSQAFGKNQAITLTQAEREIWSAIKKQEEAFIFRKAIGFLFSQGGPHKNFYNPGKFKDLREFIDSFTSAIFLQSNDSDHKCSFCTGSDFKVEPVRSEMMTFLFPVFSAFPNAYWANDERIVTSICSLCKFVLLHYHLGFTKLADGTWMFINAPSFNVMEHLNKLLRQSLGSSTSTDSKKIRELLASSIIEFTTRMQTTLGIWTGMNIEVITKRDDQVEYFSLPYQVVNLISNRQVSAMLSDIGEFRLLNLVLNEEYSKLTEVGYRLLREAISDRRNYDYINDWLYLDRNRRNLSETANKIFKLYTLIEQRGRNAYAN